VIISNYLTEPIEDIQIVLGKSEHFFHVEIDINNNNQEIKSTINEDLIQAVQRVEAKRTVSVLFYLSAKDLGIHSLTVNAHSSMISDSERRVVLVEA
jgi:hypothetical protein